MPEPQECDRAIVFYSFPSAALLANLTPLMYGSHPCTILQGIHREFKSYSISGAHWFFPTEHRSEVQTRDCSFSWKPILNLSVTRNITCPHGHCAGPQDLRTHLVTNICAQWKGTTPHWIKWEEHSLIHLHLNWELKEWRQICRPLKTLNNGAIQARVIVPLVHWQVW